MIRILGTVKQNILWMKEMEKYGLKEPQTGSVRLTISAISFNNTTYNCDYSIGKYISHIPTLEIIYKVKDSITEELVAGDLVSLYVDNNVYKGIYFKQDHFVEIKEILTGQIKFWHLKVLDRDVSHFYVNNYIQKSVSTNITKPAEEIVNMLVNISKSPTLELTQPTPITPLSAPVLKQLELA
jgi:hypothetical protein